jgi:hypothetical protein
MNNYAVSLVYVATGFFAPVKIWNYLLVTSANSKEEALGISVELSTEIRIQNNMLDLKLETSSIIEIQINE